MPLRGVFLTEIEGGDLKIEHLKIERDGKVVVVRGWLLQLSTKEQVVHTVTECCLTAPSGPRVVTMDVFQSHSPSEIWSKVVKGARFRVRSSEPLSTRSLRRVLCCKGNRHLCSEAVSR